jgi:hypothetical protein
MSSSNHAAAGAAKIEQLAKELAESTGGAAHFMSLATTLGDELAQCDSDALGAACLEPILRRLQRTLFARSDAIACHQPVRALHYAVAALLHNLDENDPELGFVPLPSSAVAGPGGRILRRKANPAADVVHVIVSARGAPFLRDADALGKAVRDVTYGKQGKPGKKSFRHVSQKGQFVGSRGSPAPAGGTRIAERVLAFHFEIFGGSKGKAFNLWSPAYEAGQGHQKSHQDDSKCIRTCYGVTEDGSPRELGLRNPNGVVYATVIDEHGKAEVVVSEHGKELLLLVPSGGFWSSDAHGAGALEATWWHEPKAGAAAAVVFAVDHGCALVDQPAAMCGAVDALVARGPLGCAPAALRSLATDIEWSTALVDGAVRSRAGGEASGRKATAAAGKRARDEELDSDEEHMLDCKKRAGAPAAPSTTPPPPPPTAGIA